MICNKCKNEILQDDKFCYHCGSKIVKEKNNFSVFSNLGLIFGIVGVSLSVLAIILFFVWAELNSLEITAEYMGDIIIFLIINAGLAGVGAIVFSSIGFKSVNKTKSVLGLIFGISSLVLIILMILYFIFVAYLLLLLLLSLSGGGSAETLCFLPLL